VVAPIAAIYAGIIAVLVEKMNPNEVIEKAVDNAKDNMMVAFILIAAYILAELFMVTGVGASIIGISIKVGVTGRTIGVVAFLTSCLISVATGTSWGTFATCSPIFFWLSHVLGGDVVLTFGAILGGSAFGDNIGLISDTTIFSSALHDVEVVDRVRHQGGWSLALVAVSAILFFITGITLGLPTEVGTAAEAISKIPAETFTKLEELRPSAITLLNQVEVGVPIYMVIPVIIVIGLAVRRVQTLICLSAGILSASVLGFVAGTISSVYEVLDIVYAGASDAGSWVIPMMFMISAFAGVMKLMNAFEPIGQLFLAISKKVRHLMTCNAILCLIGNITLADEFAQMATVGPVIKDLVDKHVEGSEEDKYQLALRNSAFNDALGVLSFTLIPWHAACIYFVTIAQQVYPVHDFVVADLFKYNYFSIIGISSILILTFTGWDRFIPLFKLPAEPDVKLIRHKVENVNQA
jgi:Na+/H+ antiporter NhaC